MVAAKKESTTWVQSGTGQVAVLFFDRATGAWLVDIFRTVGGTQNRMGSWTSRDDAIEALLRLNFAPEEPDLPSPKGKRK